MPLFESAAMAWHEAFSTHEGQQDPFSEKIRSTKLNEMAGVADAELIKVKKVINALPDLQRICGMWCFTADSAERNVFRDKIMQKVWSLAVTQNPDRLKNYQRTTRLQILVLRAITDAQHRAVNDGQSLYSHAQVASALGMAGSSFIQSWKEDYEFIVDYVKSPAMAGLSDVDTLVNEINARYRHAG